MLRIWMKSISNWNLHIREHFDARFCFNDWCRRCQQAKWWSWCLYEDNLTRFIHASIMIFQLPPQSLKQNLSLKCSLRCRLQFEVLFIQILHIWRTCHNHTYEWLLCNKEYCKLHDSFVQGLMCPKSMAMQCWAQNHSVNTFTAAIMFGFTAVICTFIVSCHCMVSYQSKLFKKYPVTEFVSYKTTSCLSLVKDKQL